MSSAQPAGVYPPPSTVPTSYSAPPPAGYPMRSDGADFSQPADPVSAQTTSRGDGFWKGCCAALCCCCVLDACF